MLHFCDVWNPFRPLKCDIPATSTEGWGVSKVWGLFRLHQRPPNLRTEGKNPKGGFAPWATMNREAPMFGMFTRRSEDEQKRKREAEDRARRASYDSDTSGAGGGYPWPLGISGAGGHSPYASSHTADTSPCSSDSGSSSSSDGGSCGGGGGGD